METNYGIEIRERDDKYYHMLKRMAAVGEAIVLPGNFPVEAFPMLGHLPSWFPGGGCKTWAEDAILSWSHPTAEFRRTTRQRDQ